MADQEQQQEPDPNSEAPTWFMDYRLRPLSPARTVNPWIDTDDGEIEDHGEPGARASPTPFEISTGRTLQGAGVNYVRQPLGDLTEYVRAS